MVYLNRLDRFFREAGSHEVMVDVESGLLFISCLSQDPLQDISMDFVVFGHPPFFLYISPEGGITFLMTG